MDDSLTALLEHEHHEIDAGIEAFLEGLAQGEVREQDLTRAVDELRRCTGRSRRSVGTSTSRRSPSSPPCEPPG